MSATTVPPHPFIQPYQVGEDVLGTFVKKSAMPLPQTATAPLFTVTGGAIYVSSLIGVVSTAIGGTATNLSLGTNPNVGTANTAGIGGPTAITSLAAGSHISVPFVVGAPGLSLSAPAVPGVSNTPVVNNYHGTVAVTVIGGTVTTVTVNGVVAGSGDGVYLVPAHGTIAVTWSVVPTWTWASTSSLVTTNFGSEFITREFVVSPGTITWTTSASTTGAVTWYLSYIQLDTVPGPAGMPVPVVT